MTHHPAEKCEEDVDDNKAEFIVDDRSNGATKISIFANTLASIAVRQSLSVPKNENGYVEEELEGLDDIAYVTEPSPDESLANVGVVFDWKAGRVQLAIQSPESLTGKHGEDKEGGIHQNTATVTQGSQSCWRRTGPKNVGDNEEAGVRGEFGSELIEQVAYNTPCHEAVRRAR